MKNYENLLVSLVLATLKGKLKWTRSSVKDGYLTEIGERGIEILPPVSSPSQIAAAIVSPDNKSDPEALNRLTEWRLVVYDLNGDKEYEIPESRLDSSYIAEKLSQNVKNPEKIEYPIRFLAIGAKFRTEEEKSKGLSDLIREIDSL